MDRSARAGAWMCAVGGVALKAVQELLCHATMDMTMRYAHLSPDVKRDAVRLLDGPAPSATRDAAGEVAPAP